MNGNKQTIIAELCVVYGLHPNLLNLYATPIIITRTEYSQIVWVVVTCNKPTYIELNIRSFTSVICVLLL